MAVEAAKERRRIKRDPALDTFWTPEWATRALLARELFPPLVWEPACGAGHISQALLEQGYQVISSDIADHGYGQLRLDFLKDSAPFSPGGAATCGLVTNPPFTLATDFVDHAVNTLQIRKVAILARVAMLEGAERWQKLFRQQTLSRVWVFSRRLTMAHKDWANAPEKGGQMAMAWYVFERGHKGGTVGWIEEGA